MDNNNTIYNIQLTRLRKELQRALDWDLSSETIKDIHLEMDKCHIKIIEESVRDVVESLFIEGIMSREPFINVIELIQKRLLVGQLLTTLIRTDEFSRQFTLQIHNWEINFELPIHEDSSKKYSLDIVTV
jgi:hypothetical protein